MGIIAVGREYGQVLHDVHGDTDAAIEFLIAEQASGGDVSPACSCERIAHSPEGSGIIFPLPARFSCCQLTTIYNMRLSKM